MAKALNQKSIAESVHGVVCVLNMCFKLDGSADHLDVFVARCLLQ